MRSQLLLVLFISLGLLNAATCLWVIPPGVVPKTRDPQSPEARGCCLPNSPVRLFFVLVVGGSKLPLDPFHSSQVTRSYRQVDVPTTEDQRHLAAVKVPVTPIAATAREDVDPITTNGLDSVTFL
jgi:hypothetical protein